MPGATITVTQNGAITGLAAGGLANGIKTVVLDHQAELVDDLRKFTTPELFASLRLDLQDRGSAAQQTDVVKLDAEIADVAQADGQDIVSVRFHGLIREVASAGAEPFDELWHLVRPASGQGDWSIAGITPQAAAA